MGGYGAFKLGISKPDRFAAVASISGSLDQRSRLGVKPALSNLVMLDMARHTFGTVEDYDRSDNDLAWLLERHLENGTSVPRLYQACGTNDHNYEINKEFHRRFAGRLDLTYVEVPGRGHEWEFWDEYIRNVLTWLNLNRL
jgi:S-formylglutathione hydrolase FrmB